MNRTLTTLAFVLMSFLGSLSFASWKKIRECDGGAVVVDESDLSQDADFPIQVVVRDPALVAAIAESGVSGPNSNGEVIFGHLSYNPFQNEYSGYYSSVGTARLTLSGETSHLVITGRGGREFVTQLNNCTSH